MNALMLTSIILAGPEPDWPEIRVVLLASFALLVFLALTLWLVAWRLARQARLYRDAAQAQAGLLRAALPQPGAEDPHAALCRTLSRITGQRLAALTPLSGSVKPLYLLLREDNTQRRLLLAGAGQLRHALRAARIAGRVRRGQRWAIKVSNDNLPALETVAAAWAALAPGLDLPAEAPMTSSWELALLPPEEIE